MLNPPPVDAALTRVDYDLRANGDTVSGEARLTVDVLQQGWVSIQCASRSARTQRALERTADCARRRHASASADFECRTRDADARIVVPIATSGGTESMTLPASPSALSSVRLTISRTSVELASSGALRPNKSKPRARPAGVSMGRPDGQISFNWKRKSDDRRRTMPLRMDARVTSLIVLGEESSLITNWASAPT